MPFIAILTKTTIVMQMFNKKTRMLQFTIKAILDDIIKIVRFHITESRGIKLN